MTPSAIRHTALMTIESERDLSTGAGQTAAAHALCSGVPAPRRARYVVPDAGHFGALSGRGWREGVLPRLRVFVREHDAPPHARSRAREPNTKRPGACR